MELYKKILDALINCKCELNVPELCIELTFKDKQERDACTLLDDLEGEKLHNVIRVKLCQNTFEIFQNLDDYEKRINAKEIENDNFKKNILLIEYEYKPLIYISQTKEIFYDFNKVDDVFLFQNTISYYKLLTFLKSQEHKEDHLFYFVDYYNSDQRRIIFTSIRKQGKLTIQYSNSVPDFNNIPIKKRIDDFIEAFNEKQLPKFIKAELFNVLPSYPKEERLIVFIQNLNLILEKAEQNFEIYQSELTLDNFKIQYLELRVKYFNQFRDILSKLTTQVLAFPVSITAAAFATYKSIDSIYICGIIIFAFVAFTIYSVYAIHAYKLDVEETYKIFENDFEDFSKNSFFKKFPKELVSFEDTKSYIVKRYTFLKRCIFLYTLLIGISNTLFVYFILMQITDNRIAIGFTILFAGSLFRIVKSIFFDNN